MCTETWDVYRVPPPEGSTLPGCARTNEVNPDSDKTCLLSERVAVWWVEVNVTIPAGVLKVRTIAIVTGPTEATPDESDDETFRVF